MSNSKSECGNKPLSFGPKTSEVSQEFPKSEVEQSVTTLRNGGSLLYPTDTTWGLGCDARNIEAVDAILALKQRPANKSFIVLLDDPAKLNLYIEEVPEVAYDLLDVADKPLTIIYPGAKRLAPNVIAADGSVAIRVTSDPFCRNLIRRFKFPIVSTSANLSGEPTPKHFDDISPEILTGVDYVVDWKQSQPALPPSTIIQLAENGEIRILRK